MSTRLRSLAGTIILAATGLGAALMTGAAPASAQQTTGWAAWGPLRGSANNYATAVQLPGLGFPRATLASDSRAPAQLPSGASTYLGGATDSVPTAVGSKYGSSKGHAYLNLRPEADTPTTPSTSRYTFDQPTPATGWAFVLGDVDADQVSISATDADGAQVTATQIDSWFRGVFNYAGDTDLPRWQPATSTLAGNAAALDTSGATGWFEPSVSLSSLTFVFTRRAGFPVYQTWFAATSRTISGTVADVSSGGGTCSPADVVLRLVGPHGEDLGTRRPDASGTYSFGQAATQAGYTVAVEAPDGCAVVGPERRTVSTASDDATADFRVRKIIPQPVSGRVTASDGTAISGATITLTPPGGGTPKRVQTDTDGRYLFDDNATGAGYRVSITAPDGYAVRGDASRTVDIGTTPITDQDFTLVEQASVAGTVSGGGGPLGGATVTLTPANGPAQTTTTRGDGGYEFVHVPAGDYAISVHPPTGYQAPPARDITVGADDLAGVDFDLSRPGALGGTVTGPAGKPVEGIDIEVRSDDHTRVLTSDTSGDFFVEGLAAGQYTVTPQPPDGYRAPTPARRVVTITAAGEIRGGLDFTVARGGASTAPSSPSGTSSSAPPASGATSGPGAPDGGGSPPVLASTGASIPAPLLLGTGLLAVGLLCTLVATMRRRTVRHR